jgi:hypothetical protein
VFAGELVVRAITTDHNVLGHRGGGYRWMSI